MTLTGSSCETGASKVRSMLKAFAKEGVRLWHVEALCQGLAIWQLQAWAAPNRRRLRGCLQDAFGLAWSLLAEVHRNLSGAGLATACTQRKPRTFGVKLPAVQLSESCRCAAQRELPPLPHRPGEGADSADV